MKKNHQILFIDSNASLAEQLSQYLKKEHFDITYAHTSQEGIRRALNQTFDIIILELMIVSPNGYEVLKTIREHVDTPILILTSCDDEIDLLLTFEMGADDYLHKPCSSIELLARMNALIRRAQRITRHRDETLTFHNISVNCAKRMAYKADILLELTNTEFNIIEILMKSPGQAFSKEELTEYALGRKYTAYDRSIDVHISNLRNKLGQNPSGETWIKTVRGFGYLFSA